MAVPAAGCLAAALPAAAAAAVPQAGRAARALPCTADPEDACWGRTAQITRFAAPLGEPGGDVQADVRLAWQDGALLVRVEGLPEGASLELGLAPDAGDDSLRALWPAELQPGVSRVAVQPPLAAGQRRGLRLSARVPTAAGGLAVLPWAPSGPGDPHHAALLATLPAPGPELGLSVGSGAGGIEASAPGASAVRLGAQPTPVPRGSRGVPPPWASTGEDRASGTPPDPGWVTIDATWHAPDGALMDVAQARVWWSGPPVVADVDGLHPVPKAWRRAGAGAWRPRAGDRVCAPAPEHQEAAALLVEELQRFTGERLVVARRGACAVRIVALDTLAGALPPGAADHPMAFGVAVTPDGATLGARDTRTATWAALALADLVGPDGAAPAAALLDWPDVDERVLYHAINLRAQPGWSAETHAAFLRRVVARGRYTDLVLAPYDSFVLPGAPRVVGPHSRPVSELEAVIAAGRALGLRVWPGVTGPAHAWWLTGADPALADDATGEILDLRDGGTRARVAQTYDALLAVFGGAGPTGRVHLGHDEVLWRASGRFGDERNPATAGSPRGILMAESLRWHLDWARSRGLAPRVWSDTLLAGWNGDREGAYRALDLLSNADLDGLVVMSWAELGDPWTHLGARGLPVQRVHTGYVDWKRAGLPDRLDTIAGEGLGVFIPAPWAAHGPPPGRRNRFFHTGSVLLAGTTAWRADLTEWSIAATLDALSDAPALTPGLRAVPAPDRVLSPTGEPAPPGLVDWPDRAALGGVRFDTRAPRAASVGAPVRIDVQAPGLSLLIAALPAHNARLPLLRDARSGATPAARGLATVRLEAAGAPPVDIPLEHGVDVYEIDSAAWAGPLWGTAASLGLASPGAAASDPQARDRRVWRRDLMRPDGLPITRAEVRTDRPGVLLIVAGAAALGPPT